MFEMCIEYAIELMSGLIQSTDADYERVPVEAYGLAMLKGMGWKQGEGIGLTFKQ